MLPVKTKGYLSQCNLTSTLNLFLAKYTAGVDSGYNSASIEPF